MREIEGLLYEDGCITVEGQRYVPEAKAERLREAAVRALGICEDAADMRCDCTGYYRCLGCEQRIASRADDAADVLRDALAPAATGEGRP
jgi:hypothetical protein